MDHWRIGLSEREGKQIRALHRRKGREDERLFLAEGVRVVEDLLASPLEVEWVLAAATLQDSERGAALLAGAGERGVPIRVVEPETFARFAATEHAQGVLAVAQIPGWRWEDAEGLSRSGGGGAEVVLLLDAVQDPGNFGTLVRTAEALGVAAVVALPGTVDAWNPKAVRAAVGSSFRVPVLAASWEEAAARLRGAGYHLLAAEVGGDPPPRVHGRVGLIVGNEGAGISAQVRAEADGTVGVPLAGRAESLNVAAAAAILLYELTRR